MCRCRGCRLLELLLLTRLSFTCCPLVPASPFCPLIRLFSPPAAGTNFRLFQLVNSVLILMFATSSVIQIVEKMPFHQAMYLVRRCLLCTLCMLCCAVLYAAVPQRSRCPSRATPAPTATPPQTHAPSATSPLPPCPQQVVTTLTTVGFGDVVAQTVLGKAVVIATICIGVVTLRLLAVLAA